MRTIILSYVILGGILLALASFKIIDARRGFQELEAVFTGNLTPITNLDSSRSYLQHHFISLLHSIIEDDAAMMRKISEQMKESQRLQAKYWELYTSSDLSEDETTHVLTLKALYSTYYEVAHEAEQLSQKNQNAEAIALVNTTLSPIFSNITNTTDLLIQANHKQVEAVLVAAQGNYNKSFWFTLAGVTASLLGCAGLGVFVSKGIRGRLQALTDQMQSISKSLATESMHIAAGSQKLSESVDQQSTAVQETSATLDEIHSMVQKNSSNAFSCQEQSRTSRSSVDRGQTIVRDMLAAMDKIAGSNQTIVNHLGRSGQEMRDVTRLIEDIGAKTLVIHDIVFQTRLLSFNASVEAARAGDHGRGFAVVAEEIGALAKMSGAAAKEISGILSRSLKNVEDLINRSLGDAQKAMEESSTLIKEGETQARQCTAAFDEILSQVESLDQFIGHIVQASQEQTKGVGEISKAMNEINSAASQNSTVAHEAAATALRLKTEVNRLDVQIQNLQTFLKAGQVRGEKAGDRQTQEKRPEAADRDDLDWNDAA
jgi:methyl-accepting chemotaxis protein